MLLPALQGRGVQVLENRNAALQQRFTLAKTIEEGCILTQRAPKK